jgi:hypothetical protein
MLNQPLGYKGYGYTEADVKPGPFRSCWVAPQFMKKNSVFVTTQYRQTRRVGTFAYYRTIGKSAFDHRVLVRFVYIHRASFAAEPKLEIHDISTRAESMHGE